MGAITITNLGKAYKQYPTRWSRLVEWLMPFGNPRHQLKWVLQDLNFKICAGEAVGIIGVNGAGKSTLLKMITGTTQPTTGSVSITGRVAALLELGMGFHPDFTGRQNAVMAGQLLGMNVGEISSLMPGIEAFAEIGDYIDQPVRVYSSGMQVRLAFSVATAIRPDILIVDEALAVGDVFFQQKCFDRIKGFCKLGTTLLIVSHALDIVYSLCDRAILIESGRIALNDKPKAVIDLYNAKMTQRSNPSSGILQVVEQAISMQSTGLGESAESASSREETNALAISEIGSYSVTGVEIEAVNLYVDGQEAESFISESELTIRVRVVFTRSYLDPHVGFQIRNNRGETLFMTNTHAMKKHVGPVSPGTTVEVDFSFNAALAEGQYTVTAGVANEGAYDGQFKESLMRMQNARAFTVLRNFDSIRWSGIYNFSPACALRVGLDSPKNR